jgi:hypothetical protein
MNMPIIKKIGAGWWSAILVLTSFICLYLCSPGFIIKHIAEIVVNAIGAYLGFIGAAIIYMIQVDTDRAKTQRETIEKHKEHLRYFAGVLAEVVEYAKNQAGALDAIGVAIQKEPSVIHQLGFVASGAIDRLNRADNEAAFHAYGTLFASNAQREKDYQYILSQADFLSAQLIRIKQSFVDYRDSLYKRQLKLKELIQTIADETAFLLKESKEIAPTAAFGKYAPNALDELNSILLEYVDLNSRIVPFEEYFDKFVRPLKLWLINNENYIPLKHSMYQRSQNLLRLTKGASVTFTDLTSNSLQFVHSFDASLLREPSKRIENLLKSLNEVVAV